MKLQIFIPALALVISGANYAANVKQELCTTTTYQAFGEPKQTVKDCADPYETFWVNVNIDGAAYPTQGIGLVVPLTYFEKNNESSKSLTVQITKSGDQYTVRFQAIRNNKVINWSGSILPGQDRSLNLNGSLVNVRFVRQ